MMYEISQGSILRWRAREKKWLLGEGQCFFSSDKPCIGYPATINQSETHVHIRNYTYIYNYRRGHGYLMHLGKKVRWPTYVNYSPKDHGTNKRNKCEFSKSSSIYSHFYFFSSHQYLVQSKIPHQYDKTVLSGDKLVFTYDYNVYFIHVYIVWW